MFISPPLLITDPFVDGCSWDFTSFWQFDIIFCSMLDNHASVKQVMSIYKAYKNDKSNLIFKRMLFAKFT